MLNFKTLKISIWLYYTKYIDCTPSKSTIEYQPRTTNLHILLYIGLNGARHIYIYLLGTEVRDNLRHAESDTTSEFRHNR